MADTLSGPLLDAYIKGFLKRSRALQFSIVTRKKIAMRVFGKTPNANAYLSKCCSPQSDRHLTPARLDDILVACRTLLSEQHRKLGAADPAAEVAAFERDLCQALSLPIHRPLRASDFSVEQRFEEATTAREFGVPDLASYPVNDFSLLGDLRATQQHSRKVLDYIVPTIARAGDSRRRLDLLKVTMSIATLHHPGTRWHEKVLDQALIAAGNAQLLQQTSGCNVSDELRWFAYTLLVHLHSLSFLPTLDSPANVIGRASRSERLSATEWKVLQPSVMLANMAAEQLVEIDPANEYACRTRSALLSQHARLLAATAATGQLREANRLEKESLRHADRLPYPYGFLYTIQKDLLKSRIKSAVQKCEKAIVANESTNDVAAASAFAGLYLQLTHLHGGDPTTDQRIRQMAKEAIKSPTTRYHYSHLFDAPTVRKLLRNAR